ncbi:trehalose-phosphatase [Ruania suaedae]|uniref:trehalose-phosphatase n=1 Tax=Ruania suaedae TaxID=2897774 RepID=UPI001E5D6FC9|nr:trehalose-phosphatase [Ruania suaedae]UFU03536.1 trehalose-phosphatase [Ruania suaedae]
MTDSLPGALRAFAATPQVLVALDFDGCLAPFVTDPADARPLPEASEALRRLADCDGVQLALVSGRPVQQLRDLADPPPGTWLVGSHGAETAELDEAGELHRVPFTLADDEASLLAEVTAAVGKIAEAYPGAWVEHKPAAAVLHTRALAEDRAEEALAEAYRGPGGQPGVHTMRGNQVVEIAVVDVNKGMAIEDLRERLGHVAVLYAGDDVTDETALAVLGEDDLGIKVGAAETVARHRVADEQAMAGALADLASWRRSQQQG